MWTELPTTSAGRFSPLGPRGIVLQPDLGGKHTWGWSMKPGRENTNKPEGKDPNKPEGENMKWNPVVVAACIAAVAALLTGYPSYKLGEKQYELERSKVIADVIVKTVHMTTHD